MQSVHVSVCTHVYVCARLHVSYCVYTCVSVCAHVHVYLCPLLQVCTKSIPGAQRVALLLHFSFVDVVHC